MIFRHMLVWPSIWLGNIVLADVILDEEILPPDFERSIVVREALSFFRLSYSHVNVPNMFANIEHPTLGGPLSQKL